MRPTIAATLASVAPGYYESNAGAAAFSVYATLSKVSVAKGSQRASGLSWRTPSVPILERCSVFQNADDCALDNPYRLASRASDLTFALEVE